MRFMTNFACAVIASELHSSKGSAVLATDFAHPEQCPTGAENSAFASWGHPSEKLQVKYMLSGPFGGVGGFIKATPNVTSYQTEAGVNGTAASEDRIVFYAEGSQAQHLLLTSHPFDPYQEDRI